MNVTFLVEIFPHTRYGVKDVASVLLLLVQLEKLYSPCTHCNVILLEQD